MEGMDSGARVTSPIAMHLVSLAQASNTHGMSQRTANLGLLGFASLSKQMRPQPNAQNSRLLAIGTQASLPLAGYVNDALERAAILLAYIRIRVTHDNLTLRRQEPEPYWR